MRRIKTLAETKDNKCEKCYKNFLMSQNKSDKYKEYKQRHLIVIDDNPLIVCRKCYAKFRHHEIIRPAYYKKRAFLLKLTPEQLLKFVDYDNIKPSNI